MTFAYARRAGVRHVVACSSLGVTFPEEPERSGRRAFEDAVVGWGGGWTLLRPGGFAQNFSEGFLVPGVRSGTLTSATGSGAVAFVDAGDIADVATKALVEGGHEGQTYALTGPSALTFAEAGAMVGARLGHAVEHRAVSGEEVTALLTSFGLPPEYVAIVVRDQRAIANGHGATPADDVARVLGRPARSFADAMQAL